VYNLFIDDERDPIDVKWGSWQEQSLYRDGEWIIARNWYDVLEILITFGFPTTISFDHDLGDGTPTGYDIAKKIGDLVMNADYQIPKDFQYFVHSKNPIGKQNIEHYMNNFLNHMRET
jgi:hypothetical protein